MNTFGSPSLQFGLVDHRVVPETRQRFGRHSIDRLNRANSFYCPSGRWPARGWVLLPRADYESLNPYATNLQLNIGDTRNPDNVGTIKNLAIVQAQCVTRGLLSDSEALYLIELTDPRGILENHWFQFPTTSFYNIRAPGYPQTFYPNSTNSGTTWTWSTLLQNLWTQMGTFLGAWPGLPSTPVGTPEGFDFPGVSAWDALCNILEHLGMIVTCDLTRVSPYSIVNLGTADATLAIFQAKYPMEEDLEWLDVGAGRVPGTITVLFRRRNSVYGTEETVRYDSPFQWEMTAFYTVSVSAPATFTGAVGQHYIWSDYTVRYDQDGSPFAADVATATTIAQERVAQYFAKVYRQTSGFMSQTYAGALPFTTGSLVDGVCWYRGMNKNWKTQIVRGPSPPWPDMWE